MKKLVPICLLFAVLFTTQVLAAPKLTKDTKIPEAIAIEIDKGKFDENSQRVSQESYQNQNHKN